MFIVDLIIFFGLFVGCKGWKDVFWLVGFRDYWDRRLVCYVNVNVGFVVGFFIIIVFVVYFCIFFDFFFMGFVVCYGVVYSVGDDIIEGN